MTEPMGHAELFLRTIDIGRPEPAKQVLDHLEADGHARHGFCDKCWIEAGRKPLPYLARLDAQEEAAACLD